VHWRFLDAGQLSLPSVSSLPASKNQNKTGFTFAEFVRRKGARAKLQVAYLATKRRAASAEVKKLQIRAAMKAMPIPDSDLIMLTRLSHT
jgi:hypothetical protein